MLKLTIDFPQDRRIVSAPLVGVTALQDTHKLLHALLSFCIGRLNPSGYSHWDLRGPDFLIVMARDSPYTAFVMLEVSGRITEMEAFRANLESHWKIRRRTDLFDLETCKCIETMVSGQRHRALLTMYGQTSNLSESTVAVWFHFSETQQSEPRRPLLCPCFRRKRQ